MYRSGVFKILSGLTNRATEEMKLLIVSQSQGTDGILRALRQRKRTASQRREKVTQVYIVIAIQFKPSLISDALQTFKPNFSQHIRSWEPSWLGWNGTSHLYTGSHPRGRHSSACRCTPGCCLCTCCCDRRRHLDHMELERETANRHCLCAESK